MTEKRVAELDKCGHEVRCCWHLKNIPACLTRVHFAHLTKVFPIYYILPQELGRPLTEKRATTVWNIQTRSWATRLSDDDIFLRRTDNTTVYCEIWLPLVNLDSRTGVAVTSTLTKRRATSIGVHYGQSEMQQSDSVSESGVACQSEEQLLFHTPIRAIPPYNGDHSASSSRSSHHAFKSQDSFP